MFNEHNRRKQKVLQSGRSLFMQTLIVTSKLASCLVVFPRRLLYGNAPDWCPSIFTLSSWTWVHTHDDGERLSNNTTEERKSATWGDAKKTRLDGATLVLSFFAANRRRSHMKKKNKERHWKASLGGTDVFASRLPRVLATAKPCLLHQLRAPSCYWLPPLAVKNKPAHLRSARARRSMRSPSHFNTGTHFISSLFFYSVIGQQRKVEC